MQPTTSTAFGGHHVGDCSRSHKGCSGGVASISVHNLPSSSVHSSGATTKQRQPLVTISPLYKPATKRRNATTQSFNSLDTGKENDFSLWSCEVHEIKGNEETNDSFSPPLFLVLSLSVYFDFDFDFFYLFLSLCFFNFVSWVFSILEFCIMLDCFVAEDVLRVFFRIHLY